MCTTTMSIETTWTEASTPTRVSDSLHAVDGILASRRRVVFTTTDTCILRPVCVFTMASTGTLGVTSPDHASGCRSRWRIYSNVVAPPRHHKSRQRNVDDVGVLRCQHSGGGLPCLFGAPVDWSTMEEVQAAPSHQFLMQWMSQLGGVEACHGNGKQRRLIVFVNLHQVTRLLVCWCQRTLDDVLRCQPSGGGRPCLSGDPVD